MFGTVAAILDPVHEDRIDWIGGYFDPEKFDLEKVAQELRRIK